MIKRHVLGPGSPFATVTLPGKTESRSDSCNTQLRYRCCLRQQKRASATPRDGWKKGRATRPGARPAQGSWHNRWNHSLTLELNAPEARTAPRSRSASSIGTRFQATVSITCATPDRFA